jgi:heptosyltransferase-1
MTCSSNQPALNVRLTDLKRIIVIRLGALGDVVRTMPAVQALRAAAPQARIAWLVDDRCAPILDGLEYVDELLVVPRRELRAASRNPFAWPRWLRTWRAFRRTLEAWRADAVLDFHGLWKTGVLTAATGAPLRVGYVRGHSKEGSWRAYTVRVDPGPVHIPRLERNLALVERLGATRLETRPQLAFSQAERDKIAAFLEPLDASRVVALFPGASKAGRRKRWPAPRFAALADLLVERLDRVPLIAWGPGEEQLVAEIRTTARREVLVAPPTSQKELALLLGHSSCTVGGDTSAIHLASIMGTPVVVVMLASDPIQNQPMPYSPFRIVEPPPGAPYARSRTADVAPETVLEAVAGLLAQAEEEGGG